MNTALMVSQVLLWLIVIALGAVCLALIRQIGILHERIKPVGALMIDKGPAVGAIAPIFELQALQGSSVKVGGARVDGRSTLLFFVSPTCPVCKKLLGLMPSIEGDERRKYRVVLASDGDVIEHTEFVRRAHLGPFPYLLSRELGMAYHIGRLPYALVISAEGVVRAKGLVNTREQLESLLEANEAGVASIQEYVHGKHEVPALQTAQPQS